MQKTHLTRLSAFVLGAIVLILLMSACGGRGHRSLPPPASHPMQPQPAVEQSVQQTLAQLDALAAPAGVDASVFNELKQALRAELLSRFGDKIVSGPPTGPENEVTDFAFEDNGDGTYTFSWSYFNVGDYNQDSIANVSDLTPLAVHFNESADAENEWIDGNGDTVINIADITPLAAHFFNDVGWYSIQGAEEADGTYEEIGTVPFSEGTEGSRLRFGAFFPVGSYRFFQVIAYSAAGLPGAGSRRVTFGPSAQAHAEADGREVQFFGVGSDPHGGNVAFLWDFESDGTFDTRGAAVGINPDTDSGEQSPTHTYPADGTYTATLRVYDSSGNYSEAKVTVGAYDSTPASAAPSVSALVLDLTGEAPFHVRLRSFSEDPDGGDILLYNWDFGDGSPLQTNATVDHTYMNPGTFTVRLTIEDEEAQQSDAQLVIKVCPAGSIPDLHPSAVNVPFVNPGSSVVGFVGQSSDMDGGPETYMWDFGDNSAPDTTQDPNHLYPGDGVYYATVHARDDENNHSSAGSTFIVGSPTDELPSAFAVAYITSGTQNMLVQFFGEGEFLDSRAVDYSWDFDGDGTYGDYSITDADPIVAYTAVGNYQVGLRVMDAGDHSKYSSASATITVHPCLMPTPPPPPPAEIPTVPIPTPPPLGNPINARCYPCPLSIAHGPDGGTLWVIYSDSSGMDPLAAGYPKLSQIQQFAPNPVAPWLWGPRGEIDNTANGNAGADIAVPYPPGTAPSPPPGANVKPGESWTAYQITRPKDGPPRVERLDFKFHLKRADGSAFASQTCIVYAYHAVDIIQEPLSDEYVSGGVTVIAEVDPTGTDATIGFIDLDPGSQINVYLDVDGTVVDPLAREGDTNMWSGDWDSTSVANGPHTLTALLYDSRDPQPGEADDPGPFWESDPVTVNVDNGPPMQTDHVTIEMVPMGSTNVGGASDIMVTTEDSDNNPVFEDFLDVFVAVSPKRSETMSQLPNDPITLEPRTHERIIPLTPDGSGHYVTIFSWQVAGTYALSAIVVDTRVGANGDKVPGLTAAVDYDVLPGDVANVQLYGRNSAYGPAYFWAEDSWGDVHPSPNVGDFNAWTDTPALHASSPAMVPGSNSMLETHLSATDYAVGMLTIEHPLSGSVQQQFVGYPPWDIQYHLPGGGPAPGEPRYQGVPSGELFEADFHIRVPDTGKEWNTFETQLIYDANPHFGLLSVTAKQTYDNFTVTGPTLEGDHYRLVVSGNLPAGTSMGGEVVAYSLECMASTETVATDTMITVDPDNLPQLWDATGMQIWYDPAMFAEFCYFPFQVKPTKTLNMHIYRVQGAATDAEIQADVDAAENMFNLNALMCTLGFYVDFVPTITTIPTADWNQIDEDHDGLDRYDANGDGDYGDEGDNNDLFNAMAEPYNYYDSTIDPPTENIYYVPGIRGGAMGTTYWPNSQVAVDNSQDSDNLTLAHEKVHELDLRKDGDFDVKDGADMNSTKDGIQRDPTAEAQGAYEADNIMNYSDTGSWLSATQGAELDP